MGKWIKVLEQPAGVGPVFDRATGASVGRAHYSLVHVQEMHRTETFGGIEDIEGLTDTRGVVQPADRGVHLDVGRELTLHLADGRRLDFFVADSAGTVAAQRVLYRPAA